MPFRSLALSLVAIVLTALPCSAQKTYEVNSALDLPDADVTDGQCDISGTSGPNPQPYSGLCTLRAAIMQAMDPSAGASPVIIIGPQVGLTPITVLSPLPAITKPITITTSLTTLATVQYAAAGSSGDAFALSGGQSTIQGLRIIGFTGGAAIHIIGAGVDKIIGNTLGISSSGLAAGNLFGIVVTDSSDNTLGDGQPNHANDIEFNLSYGIFIEGNSARNKIYGNSIGTDSTGTRKGGNRGRGIGLKNAIDTQIGGSNVSQRNLIEANLGGIEINQGSGAKIFGNYIGFSPGAPPGMNGNAQFGIAIHDSQNNFIGSPPASTTTTSSSGGTCSTVVGAAPIINPGQPPGNVIANNDGAGISIDGQNATGNQIQNDMIGVDPSGLIAQGNTADGVFIQGSPNNLIGGKSPKSGNLISGNGNSAIDILGSIPPASPAATTTGTTTTGTTTTGTTTTGTTTTGTTTTGPTIALPPPVTAIGNVIEGNWMGVDLTGQTAMPNAAIGLNVVGAQNTTIGDGSDAGRNLISGNGVNGAFSGVYIQGTTATGNRIRGNIIGLTHDGLSLLPNSGDGVTIDSAPDNSVGGLNSPGSAYCPRNLISGNALSGIRITGTAATRTHILGNYIGTDATGAAGALPKNQTAGVYIDTAPGNFVGEDNVQARNIVSNNNGQGVLVSAFGAHDNVILANYIGTDVSGMKAVPNLQNGVAIIGAPNTVIGGTSSTTGQPPGNVISGNQDIHLSGAIGIAGSLATGTRIQGNLIGVASDNKTQLPNQHHGIFITQNAGSTVIGAPWVATPPTEIKDANVIAFNQGAGIFIDKGTAGLNSTGNSILDNFIYSNKELGIDLDGYNVPLPPWRRAHATDVLPAAQSSGPNLKQQMPLLYQTAPGAGGVATLDSLPNTDFNVQFFSSPTGFVKGAGQGQHFISETIIHTDAEGFQSLTMPPPQAGEVLSAIVTSSANNSSEFAMLPCVVDPKAPLSATLKWVDIPSSFSLSATDTTGKITDPILAEKDGASSTLFLHVSFTTSQPQPDDDFTQAVLSVTYQTLDWRTGQLATIGGSGKPATPGMVNLLTTTQPFDQTGTADVPIASGPVLRSIATGDNVNFVRATAKVCYRGRAIAVASTNLLHVVLQRTVVFLPGVLGSQIWVNAAQGFTASMPPPAGAPAGTTGTTASSSAGQTLAYPIPRSLVSIPFYSSWIDYLSQNLAITNNAVQLQLLSSVNFSTIPPFSVVCKVIPGCNFPVAKVYAIEQPLQDALTKQLPRITINSQPIQYVRLQSWPYDWRQRVDTHVASLFAGHCGSGTKCFGSDPVYGSPPSISQIVQHMQSDPANTFGTGCPGPTNCRDFLDSQVSVAGHSTGGLIARSAINDPRAIQFIDRAFFINTPLQGAPKAYYAYLTGIMVEDLIAPEVMQELAPTMPIAYYLAPVAGYTDPDSKDQSGNPNPDVVMIYQKPSTGVDKHEVRAVGESAEDYMDPAINYFNTGTVSAAGSSWSLPLQQAADAFFANILAGEPAIGWENALVFWNQNVLAPSTKKLVPAPATPGPAVVTAQGTAVIGPTSGDGTVPTASQTGAMATRPAGRVPQEDGFVLRENTTDPAVHDQAANTHFVWDSIVENLQTPIMASYAILLKAGNPLPITTPYPAGTSSETIGETEMTNMVHSPPLKFADIAAASLGAPPPPGTPSQGFDAVYCDGKLVSQVTAPVYYQCDGTLVVGEAKGGYDSESPQDILADAYDYRQGTIEWARKAAEFVLNSKSATAATTTTKGTKQFGATSFLDALANGAPISIQLFHADFSLSPSGLAGQKQTSRYITDAMN